MKVALFGIGYWGSKIFNTLNKIQGLEVVVVDNKRPSSYGAKYASLNQILKDDLISHCFISTPEETHFLIAKKCLKHNKNVFVEKPISLSIKNTSSLIDLAKRSRALLFCDYIFLYDPAVEVIKKHILNNSIGQLMHIESIRHSISINKPYISIINDLALHDIYLGRHFFDSKISEVLGVGISMGHKHAHKAQITYVFNPNNSLSANYSWINPSSERKLTFFGKKGVIEWIRKSKFDLLDFYSHEGRKLVKNKTEKVIKKKQPLELVIREFLLMSRNGVDGKLYEQYYEDAKVLECVSKKYSVI